MKTKINYGVVIGITIFIVVIAIAGYFGAIHSSKVHMDNNAVVVKNITVVSKGWDSGMYWVNDTNGTRYFAPEQVEFMFASGKNYTISVTTINNQSGYWITASKEIKQPVKPRVTHGNV
jgi:hypothetical protein